MRWSRPNSARYQMAVPTSCSRRKRFTGTTSIASTARSDASSARADCSRRGYGRFYVDPIIDEIVGRTLLTPVETHWTPGNWLLLDGYRTIPFPGEEVRVPPVAIHLAWTRGQFEAYVRSWSVVQRIGEQVTDPGFAELANVWPDEQLRHVTMPLTTRVARL